MSPDLTVRKEECATLEQMLNSKRAEFLALYGRRRVGKTYLIRHFFKNKNAVFFNVTGTKNAPTSEQIKNFISQIGDVFFGGTPLKSAKNWIEAFEILTNIIRAQSNKKPIILFFDEFPWLATKNSRLLQHLEYFWNQHWSNDTRIKLIICGSSASWIIHKILKSKGGLHNRTTREINLEPLDLKNTKKFLSSINISLNNKQVLQLYMALGGIPHYLLQTEKGLSATQMIEKLAFRKRGFLLEEFDKLFSSLFDDHEIYVEIVRAIAKHKYGISQQNLLDTLGSALQGKGGTTKLKTLEETGFIIGFKPHLHRKRGKYYKVIDEYTLFYLNWIEPIKDTLLEKGLRKGYWDKIMNTPKWNTWSGYSFEAVCYKHLPQIGEALQLSPTAIPNTWRYSPKKKDGEKGAQIDLLFDRNDDVITICEIKYSSNPFVIDKVYAQNLLNKIEVFKKITKTSKEIFIAMIAANGLKQTMYSEELITGLVTLDDLFKNVE